jgi:hypothetical protein
MIYTDCNNCPQTECLDTQRKLVRQILETHSFSTEDQIAIYFMHLGAQAAELAFQTKLALEAQPLQGEN